MMKIEKVSPWSAEAQAGLALTATHDRAAIIEGVNRGELECWRLWDGQAWMVTRVYRGVLTVACYEGVRVVEAARWLRARMAQLGLSEMVIYTSKPGLLRLLHRAGLEFRAEETMYRARVGAAS